MSISVDKADRQLVIFDIDKEAFGVDIGTVREIIHMQNITKIPGVPEFVKGVIDLRGKVIPIVDLRRKFGSTTDEQNKANRIVVMGINGQDIGVIVDAVSEVLRIPVDSVVPPSSVITTTKSDYIMGIARLKGKLIILLDMNKILSQAESISLHAAQTSTKEANVKVGGAS